MSSLKFAETHNVVVFLEKPKESDGFAEIIDFLKASSIHYALTLQALVDKKRVIVTESSIRRDLHLHDAEGTDCLPTATIFEELARMGYEKPSQKLTFYKAFFSPQWKYFIHTITQCLSAKSTVWNEFSSSMAFLIICLETNQKFNLSKYIFDAMVKYLDGGVKFLMFPLKKSVRYAEMYRSQSPRGNQRNWNGQKSNQLGKDFVMYNKACYICGSFNHLQINCHSHQRRGIVSRNNYNRVDAKNTHPNVLRNMSPKAVLLKTGLTPLNIVRPVNTAHPKIAVHSAKSKTHFSKQAQSTAKRPFYKQTTLTRRSVHEAKRHYYTRRHNAVNTARSYTGQVNAIRVKGVNIVKSSAYWVWRPTKSNGASLDFKRHNYIDARGRSKSYDGGYVAFGGGAYGGRITSKGTLKTDNLDFEDVYFVNELKFNLFSVSQMCDKKNYVLFTDTECLVLSLNFKLLDENHILFKIPRKDNMYSFDMKNIVPKESLTCFVAKATLDESMLWH
ncbi:hypothetical protein Tco_0751422 [Tanacetum coccineum]|uniref:Uncharacterized protein n=1 Tax=Tanacetum coccineum TaxID=301880 RepID=A0ABQ4Z5L6_9ASTR